MSTTKFKENILTGDVGLVVLKVGSSLTAADKNCVDGTAAVASETCGGIRHGEYCQAIRGN